MTQPRHVYVPVDDGSRLRHGRHHGRHRVIQAVAVTCAAVLGFALTYYHTFTNQVQTAIQASDIGDLLDPEIVTVEPTDELDGESVNILVMGSDARSNDVAIGGMRSDTTMLIHVSSDRDRVEVVSIPRDAIVAIPDCTLRDGTVVRGWTGKFNIAFANGGRQGNADEAAACTINTVSKISGGIEIDHWVVLDFDGFITMIDALGGVPMDVPERIVSRKAHLDLYPGMQTMDGETALAFARLRTAEVGSVSGSDLQRINRQHELMNQMARTALDKNLLTDLGALTSFVRAGAQSLTMDSKLADIDYMWGLAYSLRTIDPDEIMFTTVPWAYTEDFLNVEFLPEAEDLWDDIRHDRPLSVEAEDDATSRWNSSANTSTSTP